MKKHLLITNDDGIEAEGIRTLFESLSTEYDITIIAPSSQRSASGASVTIIRDIHAHHIEWPGTSETWKVEGTPVDCVKFGLEICKPDLVVSGVNKGANSGRNVFYSGTIGACVEATFKEVPSIAFSSINEEHPNFALCKPYIPLIVAHFMTHPIPKGVMINVNFPSTIIKGIKYASQGQGYWKEDFSKTRIQKPKATFSFGAQWSHAQESLESDVYYLSQGFITAVPIRVDNLTDHAHQSQHKKTFESLNTHPLFQE